MGHFSVFPDQVRADIFREQGKWYETRALNMGELYDIPSVRDAVQFAWHRQYGNAHHGKWLVVLDPHHKNSYPIMQRIEEWPDTGFYPPEGWRE